VEDSVIIITTQYYDFPFLSTQIVLGDAAGTAWAASNTSNEWGWIL
jgi:hypothetical protein